MPEKVFIIAEAGVNHNGDINIAKKMIDVASEAGADAIKFQTFKAETLVTKNSAKAEYQIKASSIIESQFDMLKNLELPGHEYENLMDYCLQRDIVFISSAFDLESIDLLNRLGMEIFKIPSGEITNLPYLRKLGALKKDLIISTGMADLREIEDALSVLMKAGTALVDITVLHCNTEYPTPFEDVNVKAMVTIKAAFPGIQVGYSDHTPSIEVPIAAVALGAKIIEKHFTLDRNMEGPDHRASLEPDELKAMVHAIRNIEKALGSGIKKPSPSELKNKPIARKSIVAAKNIRKGEPFTEENLTVKRPGTGISPMCWDEVLGQVAQKDYEKDELI